MAAIDFPASPFVGQQFFPANGVAYQWNGSVWFVVGGTSVPGIPYDVTLRGAKGDGVTDDTVAVAATLAAYGAIYFPPGRTYVLKDIVLSNSQAAFCTGALFKSAIGAKWIFKLRDYAAAVEGAYIADATSCSVAAIVFDDGRFCRLTSTRILNATTAILMQGSGADVCARADIEGLKVDTFTVTGLKIGPNVIDAGVTDARFDASSVAGLVRVGTTGVLIDQTGSVGGFGGHSFSNVVCITVANAWSITNGDHLKFSDCVADSCSTYGVQLLGTTNLCDFEGMFVGSCGAGIYSAGTSANNSFTGLRTSAMGVLPPWAAGGFYALAGNHDVIMDNTSQLSITATSWRGGKSIHYANTAAVLTLDGATRINVRDIGGVLAATTTFLTEAGQQSNEQNALWVAPWPGELTALNMQSLNVPGTAQTFVYTMRVEGVDTAVTCTTLAAAFGSSYLGDPVQFQVGDQISFKIVTSAGATDTVHRGYFEYIRRGG